MDEVAAPHVGVDVSKERLDVHVRPGGRRLTFTRDEAGLDALLAEFVAISPALIVLEATGGYEITVAATLTAARLPVAVVNPRQVRAYAKAIGRLAKTDRLDAEVIALFAEQVRPDPRPVPDASTLAELVTRCRQLVDMIGAETNRRSRVRDARLRERLERHIAWLRAEVAELERDLDAAVRASPAWRQTEDLLTSVPGVGSTTARVLIADLPELGSLDRRRVAALVGVAPFNRDSGAFRGRRFRFVQGVRADVRRALYRATLTAIRRNPAVAATYERLVAAGKPGKLARNACIRKLLTILNAILRDKRPWQSA